MVEQLYFVLGWADAASGRSDLGGDACGGAAAAWVGASATPGGAEAARFWAAAAPSQRDCGFLTRWGCCCRRGVAADSRGGAAAAPGGATAISQRGATDSTHELPVFQALLVKLFNIYTYLCMKYAHSRLPPCAVETISLQRLQGDLHKEAGGEGPAMHGLLSIWWVK